ncbi:four-carbon acid sugar kinase family protein [Marivita hallyeonensis]|uniref:four-carbon acid sugar kinase family protein n=1 Tax=Marivita hallyeonensis TaxID=996342 RepID=UPI001FEA7FBC|nr:four-carbon acid sugar kinase family protein [Marivita hallyeonensis]
MTAPLLTFYGDDFTGSSAVMEVLSFAGIPTMLFLEAPDADVLARFPGLQAVGVAGVARSKDPAWMRAHLPTVFEGLKQLGAPLMHYKVCSTFDSAPDIGSIGVAAEIGKQVFDPDWIPLVVGAPAIGRYQVFGNLFAAAGDAVHRLDRHPVMSRHPVTPMDEADLGRHLSHQTELRTGCVDFRAMKTGQADAALKSALSKGAQIIAMDAMDDATLQEAGRMIAEGNTSFAIGSQGVEYALVAHWRASGQLAQEHATPRLSTVDQLFAVSGSCAPTTAAQIDHAQAKGFEILDFDAAQAVDPNALQAETDRVRQTSLQLLSEGRDVLVTSARGPNDPSLARMSEAINRAGISNAQANEYLGQALGNLVADIRLATGLPRAAIGGGDTSGHALTALQADALSAVAPLAPGAPLCRIHSARAPQIDGLEVTLKGGQMGAPDFFIHAKGTTT